MISQGDLVYIAPESATLEVGSHYKIFRTLNPPLNNKKTRALIGYQHVPLGIVKITSIDKAFILGKIYRSWKTIKVGDQLMNYIPANPQISLIKNFKGLTGRIIAADEGQKLIGEHMLVFLDKGRDDGVERGQRYLVYEQKTGTVYKKNAKGARPASTVLNLPPVDYGTLLVLHVEDTTATALVTSSDKHITPGDAFRAP